MKHIMTHVMKLALKHIMKRVPEHFLKHILTCPAIRYATYCGNILEYSMEHIMKHVLKHLMKLSSKEMFRL